MCGCQVLGMFHWELFCQVRLHLFACISCDMYTIYLSLSRTLTHFNSLFKQLSHISILSLDKSHKFQFSLLRNLTHISILSLDKSHKFQFSLLRNLTHISILSFDKSHTFQSEYWITCNEFLLIRLSSNLSNKELGSQTRNMFCTKFQKHKHHKLQ
jgi:hypothetical protein